MQPDRRTGDVVNEPIVTVIVVPRERFSRTRNSLETLYANTQVPFHLIYVDGGSPQHIRSYLKTQAEEHGFRLVRTERYLSPNQARNIGLGLAQTKYVVFVDNDVEVAAGWLSQLLQCAEETDAWLVGPLYCIGQPAHQIIHMAGGEACIREEQGRRRLYERHRHCDQRVSDVRTQMRREACELIEFHCMLARREAFDKLGPLDEGLLGSREHLDICLAVREAGGTIWFEPNAVVTYAPDSIRPESFAWTDIPYYLLRWSDAWGVASLRRFEQKWHLDACGERLTDEWLQPHRQVPLRDVRTRAQRILGGRIGDHLMNSLEQFITKEALRKGKG